MRYPPGQDRTWVPPSQVRMAYPQPEQDWGTPWPGQDGVLPPPPPRTERQSEHLLRGARYASCIHAGGLSCLKSRCYFWFPYHNHTVRQTRNVKSKDKTDIALNGPMHTLAKDEQTVTALASGLCPIVPLKVFILYMPYTSISVHLRQPCSPIWGWCQSSALQSCAAVIFNNKPT